MAYTVVRTDRLSGTQNKSKLASARYHDGTGYAEIENGMIVYLDSMIDGEREIYKATAVDADGAKHKIGLGRIALVASPEYLTDERDRNLDAFINPDDEAFRAYILEPGDVFSVTAGAFSVAPTALLPVIELTDGVKMKAVASAATNNVLGEFIGKETVGTTVYYAIRVVG